MLKKTSIAAVVGAGLIAATVAHPAVSAREEGDPIVGAWNCVARADGFLPIAVIKTIHAGGTVTEVDNAAPPSQETPVVGSWARTGARGYLLDLHQFTFDAGGNFVGTFHFVNPLRLSRSLDTLSGSVDTTLAVHGGG